MGPDTTGISCCFDEQSTRMLKEFRKRGLSRRSAAILAALPPAVIQGTNVLELGCGFGALTIELLRRGAASGVGVDLSKRMIQMADSLAAETGLAQKASFKVGEGAKDLLPPSDIVVLDAVICCYPDAVGLVEHTSSASRKYYILSLPDDRRPVVRALKLLLPLQWFLFRRRNFRFHVHKVHDILGQLSARGFEVTYDSKVGRIWSVILLNKTGS